MSYLTVVQNVIDELALNSPTTVSIDDVTTQQVRRLVNKEGKILALMQSVMGGGWSVLERAHEFTTTNGVDEYALPDDVYKILFDTPWDRSRTRRMFGPLTTGEWQQLKSGLKTGTIYTSYRMKRSLSDPKKVFFIDPPPSESQTLFFEYLSNAWATDETGTNLKTELENDTDVSLIPELLLELGTVWRWKKAKGEDYAADLAEYEVRRDTMFGADSGPRIIAMNKSQVIYPLDGDVPETGIGLP